MFTLLIKHKGLIPERNKPTALNLKITLSKCIGLNLMLSQDNLNIAYKLEPKGLGMLVTSREGKIICECTLFVLVRVLQYVDCYLSTFLRLYTLFEVVGFHSGPTSHFYEYGCD